jgi:acyl carrier protein
MQSQQLSRVAQLTQRTNQFNLTTIRRTEAEIQQICNSERLECRVVKVKDRFGDYGLVGLLLFADQENALIVDTFLLSCRVLGRGVEHKMLAYLGTLAQERGLGRVGVLYTPTNKNQPAKDFLTSVGRQFQQEKDGSWLFEFPSQAASESSFLLISDIDAVDKKTDQEPKFISDSSAKRVSDADFFERIARNLYSPELILKEIASRQQRQRSQLEEFVAPRNPIEKAIAHLFAEILKLDRVSIDDNFFELGGDSIRGAILINKLQAQLNEIIHFVVLFDTRTVANLAAYIEENYPRAGAKLLGKEINSTIDTPQERIGEAKVLQMRSLIPPLAFPIDDDAIKNPPAIFILSPHRSGSTLLRVILGGNPQLFAPPELELLTFNTLGERKAAFSGRYSFWAEGTIRTIMQIRGCSPEEAIALMEELEAKNLSNFTNSYSNGSAIKSW